jgi:hypothetical protein
MLATGDTVVTTFNFCAVLFDGLDVLEVLVALGGGAAQAANPTASAAPSAIAMRGVLFVFIRFSPPDQCVIRERRFDHLLRWQCRHSPNKAR